MAFFRTNQPMQPLSGLIRLDFSGESPTEAELAAPVVYSLQGAAFALRGQCRLGDLCIEDEVGAAKVLEAYKRSGAAFLSELRGPFALVITVPDEKIVTIGSGPTVSGTTGRYIGRGNVRRACRKATLDKTTDQAPGHIRFHAWPHDSFSLLNISRR